ncbi:MAG: hypothetical protein ACOCQD_04615 [archaeon]
MSKQEIRLKNDYDCIKALYQIHKDDGWIEEMVNENFIADRFIYCDTRNGLFFNNYYSYNAIVNLFNNKKNNDKRKNEYDHLEKTKILTRRIWKYFSKNPTFEEFKLFLIKNVKIVIITREENKNPESRNIENPIDRYKSMDIDYIYRKTKNIRWNKIEVLEDLLTYFDRVKIKEFFNAKRS